VGSGRNLRRLEKVAKITLVSIWHLAMARRHDLEKIRKHFSI